MNDIAIRPMTRGDIPGLEILVATREGLDAARASLWAKRMAWIAFDNPYRDGGPSYFVADRRGELVGYLGRMATQISGRGESFPACFVHDLYVAPACRAEGLGYPLAMALYKAVEDATEGLLVGLWTNAINLQLKKRRGYRILEHLQLVRVLDPAPYVYRVLNWRPLRRAADVAARAGLAGIDLFSRVLHPPRVDLVETARFDSAHDRLAERLRGKSGLRTHPRSDVLNWKYVDLPGADFLCLSAVLDHEVVGYVVATKGKAGTARLVDLHGDPEDRPLISTLCRGALQELRSSGAQAVVCAATDQRFISVMRSLGFLRAPEMVQVAVRPQASEPATIHDLGDWHIGFGESDFVMIA